MTLASNASPLGSLCPITPTRFRPYRYLSRSQCQMYALFPTFSMPTSPPNPTPHSLAARLGVCTPGFSICFATSNTLVTLSPPSLTLMPNARLTASFCPSPCTNAPSELRCAGTGGALARPLLPGRGTAPPLLPFAPGMVGLAVSGDAEMCSVGEEGVETGFSQSTLRQRPTSR